MNAKGLNALLIALVICFGWSIAWSVEVAVSRECNFHHSHYDPVSYRRVNR